MKTLQAPCRPAGAERGPHRRDVLGHRPRRQRKFPIHSSTKWAVIELAKSTALALAPHEVTCNALCPTRVHRNLPFNEYILPNLVPSQTLAVEPFDPGAGGRHVMPVGLHEPSRIGDRVRFLYGPQAALISGDVFDVGAALNAQSPA